jgi:sRNA-binding regulator protein Hfq
MVEEKTIAKQGSPQFIHRLIGKKVTMRLLSNGQSIIGTIKANNPYEILLETAKGEIIVPKRAIAVIGMAD